MGVRRGKPPLVQRGAKSQAAGPRVQRGFHSARKAGERFRGPRGRPTRPDPARTADPTPRGRPTGPDPADAGAVTTSGDATMAMSSHWLVFPFYLFPVFLKNENALLA